MACVPTDSASMLMGPTNASVILVSDSLQINKFVSVGHCPCGDIFETICDEIRCVELINEIKHNVATHCKILCSFSVHIKQLIHVCVGVCCRHR